MSNTLSVLILSPTGLDLIAQIDGLVDATLISDDGSTAVFSTGGTSEFSLYYEAIDGVLHVSGFAFSEDGATTVMARFTEPVTTSLDYLVITMTNFMEDILSDTRFDILGNQGDDAADGSAFGDRFLMAGGDDRAQGGQGDDLFLGGRGNDLLNGGADDDWLGGGKDSDILIFGAGSDVGRAGAGNDVMVSDKGSNMAAGGDGADLLIAAQGSQTRFRDMTDPDDFIIFTGFDLGDNVDLNPKAQTLADVANGTVDDFQWRDTADGVEIQAGDAFVQLTGVTAKDVDLNRLYFNAAPSDDLVSGLLDAESGTFGESFYYEKVEWTFGDTGSLVTLTDGTTLEFASWGTATTTGIM